MKNIIDVNAHMHTPYSFSAFTGVKQALDMAAAEKVGVVGINDFYSLDGYGEWKEECASRNLFPLFNIEFISLNSEDQAAGLRVNDPNNPGRTYLSGKGLAYPVILKGKEAQQLADVKAESNAQVEKMCARLNAHLDSVKAGFNIDFRQVEKELTRGSIRERHLAKALRMAIEANVAEAERLSFYERVFGGKPLKSDISDVAKVENEIRGNLLKSGGAAFVPEDPKAFLPMETVQAIIEAAGGIPAISEVKFSLISNRGCFGGCNFCALTFHQGRIIQTRSHESIIDEAKLITQDKDFKGYIHDVGGPTANFRAPACKKQLTKGRNNVFSHSLVKTLLLITATT